MKYESVRIAGFGYALPPVVVSTDELEERLGPVYRALRIPGGQLEALTGICERRYWEPGYPVAAGAALAATRALASTGVSAGDLDALLYGAVCREDFEPATACHVAAALARSGHRLPEHAIVHDVSNACLGVVTGMLDLANRIELGQIRTGMVVACESAREICELTINRLVAEPTLAGFTRSMATFTGGSGAVAVVVSRAEPDAPRRLRGATVRAAPAHHELCRWGVKPEGDSGGDPIYRMRAATDAAGVLEHGVALGTRTFAAFTDELGWAPAQIDRTVCHQIGAAHRDTMLPKLGLARASDFVAYEDLGNTGTVALPLATALAHERGFLAAGQRVGLLGIGSGLNCIMMGVEW